jgi:hypothetical protein
MRARTVVMFSVANLSDDEVHELYERGGRPELAQRKPGFARFEIVEFWDQPRELEAFRHELGAAGLTWMERVEHSYTDDELRSFPLLSLRLDAAERDSGGPAYGTEYDLSCACVKCGAGAVQTSALRFPETELPRRGEIFQTGSFEYLVSERLKESLLDAGVRGVELRQAQAALGDGPLPWFQVIPEHEMPPLHEATRGISRELCDVCGRSGFFRGTSEETQLAYPRVAGRSLNADFAQTYERWGYGFLLDPLSASRLPTPRLLVSPRVLDVFRTNRVRGLDLQPVRFV